MAFDALQALQAFGAGRQFALNERDIRRQEVARDRQLETRTRVGELVRGGDVVGAQREAAAGGEFDWATALGRLDEGQSTRALAEAQAGGEAARAIRALPMEQRAGALQRFVPVLRARGFSEEELAQYTADLSDGTLDGLIASADAVARILHPRTTEDPSIIRTLEAAGIDPGSEEGRVIIQQNLNRPNYLVLGNPETGQTVIDPNRAAPSRGGPPRGTRNNNPGNLEDGPFARSQPGYRGTDGRFAVFGSPEQGAAAQEALLRSRYLQQPRSVASIIQGTGQPGTGYAPPGDNSDASVQNYIAHVARRLGVDPNQPIDASRARELAAAMREFETGQTGRPGVIAQTQPHPRTTAPQATRVIDGVVYVKVNGQWMRRRS